MHIVDLNSSGGIPTSHHTGGPIMSDSPSSYKVNDIKNEFHSSGIISLRKYLFCFVDSFGINRGSMSLSRGTMCQW